MKRLVLFGCLCVSAFLARAQSSLAIVGGLHGSTITPDLLSTPDTSLRKTSAGSARVLVGFIANIPLKKNLSFQAGVLYTAKGSNHTQFYDTTDLYASTAGLPADKRQRLLSTNTTLNLAYIELPFMLVYKFPVKAATKFILGAGPQLSLLYNGNMHSNSLYVSQAHPDSAVTYRFKEAVNEDLPIGKQPDRYRVLHFGAKAFGGMEFGRVFFTVNYTQDLTEFYEGNNQHFKAQTLGANLGIYLGKRNAATPPAKASKAVALR